MKFSAQLDVNVVAVEATDEVSVLLDLQSTQLAADVDRPAATLQVVLDRSGSMSGRPLQGAIEALCGLVARLDERDNFGVVVFDDNAQVVVPAGPLVDKQRVSAQLMQVVSGGMTDLSGGYLRGLQELKRAAGGAGGTLLLISDGHANRGITDGDQLEKIAAGAAADRIVTSTLGYGLGYDETALSALARGGSGNHHFAEDLDTAGAAVASEAGELLAKSVQAAGLLITMEPAVALVKIYNDLPLHQGGRRQGHRGSRRLLLQRATQTTSQIRRAGDGVARARADRDTRAPVRRTTQPALLRSAIGLARDGTVALRRPDAAPQENFLCSAKPVTLQSLVQAASGRTRAAWGEARALWIEDLAATP